MKRIISSVVSVVALVTACSGGFTPIGEGDGGASGSGNGKAGSSNAGSSSTSGPCDQLPCGASCNRCDPASADCDSPGYCDADGQCGLAFPVCDVAECQSTADCAQPGAPCEQCPDGSFACPTVECTAGQCVGSFPTCTGQTCTDDAQCPQIAAPCQVCADGSAACPYSRCDNGSCVSGIDSCPDSDPCDGKSCGETCSLCAPGQACPAVVSLCDENLKCQYNQPVCGTDMCSSDEDCPGVGACPPCPNSDGACAELKCVEGACKFQCPPDGGTCSAQGESCAQGETCCAGLECCAGVPVPPGEEYCGQTCPISDVNMKRDFASVNQGQILEQVARLPISSWSYKTEESNARHIGPMAQDFMAAFGVGSSDKTILQVDGDGVALAAIQALYQRLQELEQRNAELERQVQQLESTSVR